MRFMQWVLGVALSVGMGSALIAQTYEMAKAAVDAHQHRQMSYSRFTKAMLGAKPRASLNQNPKP